MNLLTALFFKNFTGYFGSRAAKKYTALLFMGILLVLSTTGCQLANDTMSSANDTLIGLYVTRDAIDPVIGENNYYLSPSGSLSEKNTDGSRVYGNLDKENETISFPDINGFALLCVQKEENGNTYFQTIINEIFSDTDTSIINDGCEIDSTLYYDSSKVTNHHFADSTETYLEDFEDFDASRITTEKQEDGTILYDYATDGEELTLYVHPIYETADGEVYLIAEPGDTFLSQGDISTSFSSSESSTAGSSTTESNYRKFTVSVKAASPVEKVIFTQFDSKGNVLQEDTYTSANMPETYTRKRDSAYILVSSTDLAGNITYSTINREDEIFSLYLPTDDIFCEDASINIED